MQKWEYRIVNLDHNPDTAEAQLNALGEQGWELVAIYNTTTCYLKRPSK